MSKLQDHFYTQTGRAICVCGCRCCSLFKISDTGRITAEEFTAVTGEAYNG